MKRSRRLALALALALLLAVPALVVLRPWQRTAKARSEPLSIVPPGPAFVLELDVERLRSDAASEKLAVLALEQLLASRGLQAFEAARDVDTIVVVVPAAARLTGERGLAVEPDAVAVIAAGSFEREAVADAARRAILSRGGEPSETHVGSFVSVRDLRGTGEVAARDGLLVLSDGAYLRVLLAAADGRRARGSELERARDAVHAELRKSYGAGAPLVATLTLPPGTLEAALGDPEARRSPLSAIQSAALRVSVGENLDARALFICESASDAERLAKLANHLRADAEAALGRDALAGHRLEIAAPTGERLELSLSVARDAVTRLLAAPAPSR